MRTELWQKRMQHSVHVSVVKLYPFTYVPYVERMMVLRKLQI
jgi:hypothetical protein